jgi:Domain of Unknown Function with PDB structure (DUF3857)
VKAIRFFLSAAPVAAAIFFLSAPAANPRPAQTTSQKPAEKAPEKSQEKPKEKAAPTASPKLPAEIELLETRVRFETNGDSRKEVQAHVKINDELGVRQFARLNFDFNRAFEQIEIPLVRITHPSGGTVDVLPSAITDMPNPAVVNAPAYQDVRVKSVRILGLEPGDSLEYRVITTTTHQPLAPDFWLDHTFDRTGVVSREIFELDLPSPGPSIRVGPATPASSTEKSGEGDAARTVYKWDKTQPESASKSPTSESDDPDVVVSTQQWETLSIRLDERLSFQDQPLKPFGDYESNVGPPKTRPVTPEISSMAFQLTRGIEDNRAKLVALYDFVSQKVKTVDIPLGSTGFVTRPAAAILASGYATQEDKFVLFAELTSAVKLSAGAALTGYCNEKGIASPLDFKRMLISASDGKRTYWIDPSLEIAPFGLIPPNSGKCAFVLNRFFHLMNSNPHEWQPLNAVPPFPSTQKVAIDATLDADGKLTAKPHYVMRGDNELLLRVAFHQSPKAKWSEVAQLLALSDGFRGKVSNVTTSDPFETHDPFTVEYEISQPKFADWSKKPLRIPALLPLLGLPDPPAKPAPGAAATPIDLGTPLDVEVSATVHLPAGTTAQVPTGTSLQRDFATYTSQYSAKDATLTASRHLNFILKEIPADRAADYNAFLRAVQNDQSQVFTLERAVTTPAPPKKP